MDNDNSQPLTVAGKLPKTCYKSLQEFVNDIAKVLRIPIDTISIAKGATGETGLNGNKGDKGDKGDRGQDGLSVSSSIRNFDIPNGATYLQLPIFDGWDRSFYQVYHKGQVGSTDVDIPNFDPAAKVVSIGTIIQVYGTPVTLIRVYFTFLGVSAVPDANHTIRIISFT